ncbi:MAG: hypothetical protein WAN46_01515, partial [Gammaproteobacteria bacterium]
GVGYTLEQAQGTEAMELTRQARETHLGDEGVEIGSAHPVDVESRCGAVVVGTAYLFPPLSSGGASRAEP